MILTDIEIRQAIRDKRIVVSPFDESSLRINSLDVHLGNVLMVSARHELDAARDEQWDEVEIPTRGMVLEPGRLYLAVTREYTESHCHVPYLDGKSSVGRLGCFIHATAGRGDVGFCGHWTMELSVVQPLRIYPGIPIGQLTWHTCNPPSESYGAKAGSTYGDSHKAGKPVPSGLWKKLKPEPDDFQPCQFCGDPTRHRGYAEIGKAETICAAGMIRPLCKAPECRARAMRGE